ncbi:uncharacterized protein ric3a [Leuresthes tenuis]|uniref:uncharacterized protein ric3a n=1 Tax=Leuresthes tenuis TaxID=355514 RepID=UPI003B509916
MKMERIVSGRGHSSSSGRRRKSKSSTSKKEEKLLKQLRQITLLMQEGRFEGASPEMEAEQVPYGAEWEGYPEETYPEYDVPFGRRGFETFRLEEAPSQPTAEALAERMMQEEEELMARKLSIVQEEEEEEEDKREDADEDEEEEVEGTEEEVEEGMEEEEEEEDLAEKKWLLSPPLLAAEKKQERVGLEVSRELQHQSGGKKQISFSEQKHVFRYPREDTFEEEGEEQEEEVEEEDEGTEVEEVEEEEEEAEDDEEDPLMEAESLLFSCGGSSNPEEEAEEDKEESLLMSVPVEGDGHVHADVPKEVGVSGLRMRNRRET